MRKALDVRTLYCWSELVPWWVKAEWPDLCVSISDSQVHQLILGSISRTESPCGANYWARISQIQCGCCGTAGIGGILRNSIGASLIYLSKYIGIFDVSTTELLAVEEACTVFFSSKWSRIYKLEIESDCNNVHGVVAVSGIILSSLESKIAWLIAC
ncbi:hypothetical protein V6N13_037819 [Hibiscus sabdariffa]|uniref:RNase H type-1 domain-containing protein n=1 Tax=Hibiscus sabdariffa TaxID=183260 RepID=A0ABR2S447_9ROSI